MTLLSHLGTVISYHVIPPSNLVEIQFWGIQGHMRNLTESLKCRLPLEIPFPKGRALPPAGGYVQVIKKKRKLNKNKKETDTRTGKAQNQPDRTVLDFRESV